MEGQLHKLENRLHKLLTSKKRLQSWLMAISCEIDKVIVELAQSQAYEQKSEATTWHKEDNSLLSQGIDTLELKGSILLARGREALKKGGILKLSDLTSRTEDELLRIWYVSRPFLIELKKKLAELGLSLREMNN